MKLNITIFFLLISLSSYAQHNEVWTAFYDEEEYLFGFKNSRGKVMISPKFMGFSTARKFDKIAAFMEEGDGAYKSYYMLKDGTKFGEDSLYVSDMIFDCESEGSIKFRDPETEQVGMFNAQGEVAIPAEYSEMTPFKNGMAVGLKNAQKKFEHEHDEHWTWSGGQKVLINTDNEILVADFPWNENIDFYSLIVSDRPVEDSCRLNFQGTGGKYYSFVDNEKLFEVFLRDSILNDVSASNLLKHSYPQLVFWSEKNGWSAMPKAEFMHDNGTLLEERLSALGKDDVRYFFTLDDFIPMPEDIYGQFAYAYDNCGRRNRSKYPVYNLVVNHYDPEGSRALLFQDHFTFIKTEDNIQFISCTIGNGYLNSDKQ